MRGMRFVKVMSLAAALALLSGIGSAAVAQVGEPIATPPPNQVENVTTAIIRNAITEPAINSTVSDAATFAHKEIGGKVGGRNDGLRSVTLPSTSNVVLAARDLAEKGSDVIVISGGDSQSTIGFAAGYPSTFFLDIDQPVPCITEDGRADPSGTCAGGIESIPFNYSAVGFDVNEAAYLAGVIAASASRDDSLGIISGMPDCADCNRYIRGFALGARSIKPDIDIKLAYLADSGEDVAFGDPESAKTFAKAFIDVYEPDVVLPLTGSGSRGVIEAACEAGIRAVGTDIDVSAAYPELAECILTSIIKDFDYAVREAIFAFANGELAPEWRLGLSDEHVRVTDEWTRLPGLPVDLSDRYEQARQAILTGQVQTCSADCGAPFGSDAAAAPDGPGAADEADAPDGSDAADDAETDTVEPTQAP